MFATDRDARWMNLRKGGIREERTFFVSAICGRYIAPACISRKIKNVSIPAGGEHDRVARVLVHLSGAQAARDDSLGVPIDDYQVEHLSVWRHLQTARRDLAAMRLITTNHELVTGI